MFLSLKMMLIKFYYLSCLGCFLFVKKKSSTIVVLLKVMWIEFFHGCFLFIKCKPSTIVVLLNVMLINFYFGWVFSIHKMRVPYNKVLLKVMLINLKLYYDFLRDQ